jgi:hypothetical protein
MAADTWRIQESESGWSVFRNNKVVRYDCADIGDALIVVRRKRPEKGTRVVIEPIGEPPTTKRL